MAYASKATTALVAGALGLATVTAAFVTVSSASSVADPAPVKIQDRLESEVRLISIDEPRDTLVYPNPAAAETVAVRVIPLPTRDPRSASVHTDDEQVAMASAEKPAATRGDRLAVVPLPPVKPALQMAAIDRVPVPLPRPEREMIVGSLDTATMLETR